MSVAALPRQPNTITPRTGQVRSVLVCVPPGPTARVFVERFMATGADHLVRVATTPRQALAGYARQRADVVLVDRNFARDPIGVLGSYRAPQTAVIVVDVAGDGDLMPLVARAATGNLRQVRRPQPMPRVRLTGREEQVLRRLCDGATNEEIAEELGIGSDTVKTHVRRLFDKLGARRRTQAVAMAMRAGLVE